MYKRQGLFSVIGNGGEVKNVTTEGNVIGRSYVGGICGTNKPFKINLGNNPNRIGNTTTLCNGWEKIATFDGYDLSCKWKEFRLSLIHISRKGIFCLRTFRIPAKFEKINY